MATVEIEGKRSDGWKKCMYIDLIKDDFDMNSAFQDVHDSEK